MKKRKIVLLLAALCIVSGCGKIQKVEESTVTADKKGTITQVLFEEFPAAQYDTKDLETNIRELVAEYNENAEAKRVNVESFEVKNDIAKVVLTYSSDEDYREFNEVDFFAGTVEQALEEGYAFAGDFADAEGKDVKSTVITNDSKAQQVMIIREPLQVLVPGTILYVSRNMEVLSEDTAAMTAEDEFTYKDVTTEAFGYVIYE